MTKQFAQGKEKHIGWHAEMPYLRKPKIRCTKIIDGIKYFLGYNKKLYRAEEFNNTFG